MSIINENKRQYRNLILFGLGCISSMVSVLIYTELITEEIWNILGWLAPTIPIILLCGGFFTSVYFYRRSLPE